jgi:hypothetical protein
MTPVVHLDLQIYPRIFEKIRNDPNTIIRGFGEDDSRKSKKSRDTVTLIYTSLIYIVQRSFDYKSGDQRIPSSTIPQNRNPEPEICKSFKKPRN